jgi:hypothetical protein
MNALTRARYLPLCTARLIQSVTQTYCLATHFNMILSYKPRSSDWPLSLFLSLSLSLSLRTLMNC